MRKGVFLALFLPSALYLAAMAGSRPAGPGELGVLSVLAAAFLGLAALAAVAGRRRERRLSALYLGVFAASLSSTVPLDCWGHLAASAWVCQCGAAAAVALSLADWYRGYRGLKLGRERAVRSALGRRP